MSNAIGDSVVTQSGINAILDAEANGRKIRVTKFKFSDVDFEINPNISEFEGWITKDIKEIRVLENNSLIEFTCDVLHTEAIKEAKVAGLFLEDGTLFMLAKPIYPFPAHMRQTLKVQLLYDNFGTLCDLIYTENNNTFNLDGKKEITRGATQEYFITDYDAWSNYSVACSVGNVQLVKDKIFLTVDAQESSEELTLSVTKDDLTKNYTINIIDPVVATPVLEGPTTAKELSTVAVKIVNFDNEADYNITVTNGTYSRENDTIYINTPEVNSVTTLTLSVTAIKNEMYSQTATLNIDVNYLSIEAITLNTDRVIGGNTYIAKVIVNKTEGITTTLNSNDSNITITNNNNNTFTLAIPNYIENKNITLTATATDGIVTVNKELNINCYPVGTAFGKAVLDKGEGILDNNYNEKKWRSNDNFIWLYEYENQGPYRHWVTKFDKNLNILQRKAIGTKVSQTNPYDVYNDFINIGDDLVLVRLYSREIEFIYLDSDLNLIKNKIINIDDPNHYDKLHFAYYDSAFKYAYILDYDEANNLINFVIPFLGYNEDPHYVAVKCNIDLDFNNISIDRDWLKGATTEFQLDAKNHRARWRQYSNEMLVTSEYGRYTRIDITNNTYKSIKIDQDPYFYHNGNGDFIKLKNGKYLAIDIYGNLLLLNSDFDIEAVKSTAIPTNTYKMHLSEMDNGKIAVTSGLFTLSIIEADLSAVTVKEGFYPYARPVKAIGNKLVFVSKNTGDFNHNYILLENAIESDDVLLSIENQNPKYADTLKYKEYKTPAEDLTLDNSKITVSEGTWETVTNNDTTFTITDVDAVTVEEIPVVEPTIAYLQ